MAESILKHLLGHRIFVDSVGVRSREVDGAAGANSGSAGAEAAGAGEG